MTARPPLEVADVVRLHAHGIQNAAWFRLEHSRVLEAIAKCRTEALGGHVEACDSCGHSRIAYNSCRNRHCPKCQGTERARWVAAREADLLPVPYFHVVFTLPHELNSLALANRRLVYNLLFEATSETLRRIAADPEHLGAEIGVLAILHTWGQALTLHPHLHCIIPGGGLSLDGTRWIPTRQDFLFSVRVLSKLFRGLFLSKLRRAFDRDEIILPDGHPRDFHDWIKSLARVPWVVYAKRPFGGPRQVLRYLGRYTHRVAISNNRLIALDNDQVAFSYKDYRHASRTKVMRLDAAEFLRRFLLHVVPSGFHRIRQFGLLSNRNRKSALIRCRQLLGVRAKDTVVLAPPPAPLSPDTSGDNIDSKLCPLCRSGRIQVVQLLRKPEPPPPGIWVVPFTIDSS